MKKIRLELLLLSLFFCGCAHSKVSHHQDVSSDRLFPPGLYRHDVLLRVRLPNTTGLEQKYQFSGIVRLSASDMEIVVLSQFGTTEFKIYEDLKTQNTRTEIFRESLKKFEPKLRVYYGVLRLLLLAKVRSSATDTGDGVLIWTKLDNQGYPLEMDTTGLNPRAHFSLKNYDKNHIPEEIEITHPQFNVDVKVSGYEI